ncbi:MAG: acetoacetate--CoA ligase, partial [Dehalococcoidales bacterium]|nr:acetoacetate--CoA ligase [Dehalococcoidales bacterium]
MAKLLWQPTEAQKKQANMTRFTNFINEKYGLKITSYHGLYDWSIDQLPDFWAAIWEFVQVKASRQYDEVVTDLSRFPGAKWFPSARMNFAENLLRHRDDHLAFIFKGENQTSARITYAELYNSVVRLATSLRRIGVKPGDRVAAYMPNLIETAIAMLAATSIGAVWSSCATDLGAQAVVDRLGQIEPKVLFAADGYIYKGKVFNSLASVGEISRGIPSLEKVIVVHYAGENSGISHIPNAVYYDQCIAVAEPPGFQFEQLPFEHPAFIVFSSGTTGKPKCMVQGAGGVLINHLKELILHGDLKREDTIFYITTCSWIMWNWLLSSLAVGATIVLYDGNPNYPNAGAMWQLVQEEKITIFGTSATYINYLKSQGDKPKRRYDLTSLREISQTGSALSAEGFEYVYEAIKSDLHFNSISGGTEIQTCFANGTPTLPVYAGELQCWALGVKGRCYNEKGKAVIDQMGELVCETPMPSMPLYFWNDPK